MLQLSKEIASLVTNLPLEWGSSVYLRVDEERMDMMRALIVGPEGTPYQNGIFLFDILLPPGEWPARGLLFGVAGHRLPPLKCDLANDRVGHMQPSPASLNTSRTVRWGRPSQGSTPVTACLC